MFKHRDPILSLTDYHEKSENYSVVLSKSLHMKHVLFPKMFLAAGV